MDGRLITVSIQFSEEALAVLAKRGIVTDMALRGFVQSMTSAAIIDYRSQDQEQELEREL
jgi:hypothetical protein